ncbi:MAG: PspA/IM30 family protein [Deltaproteobacteria bacterium]|nr:PspA/IM30 family protein [Deltaproteobacteria bacterium]
MMKAIRRISTSLVANFDWAVTQIENHEALVTAALREIQHSGAKAKVQLMRVRRDGERMQQKVQELQEADSLWAERALRCAPLDQSKAIECLRRRKRAQADALELEAQIKSHARLEEDLTRDLEKIEKQVEELKRKRNSLRSRESTAEALSALQSQDMGLIDELEDVFERWEVKVSEYESHDGFALARTQTLEHELGSDEEQARLKAELDELLAQKGALPKPQ